jgi:alpha-galactosidase
LDLGFAMSAPSPSRIIYDEAFKTFSLYCGESLYAFCVSPEECLEHLYWGEKLPAGFDLRYLSQSFKMMHFTTFELPNERQQQTLSLDALRRESVQEVSEKWRQYSQKINSTDESEQQTRRRMENLAWRLMSMKSVPEEENTGASSKGTRRRSNTTQSMGANSSSSSLKDYSPTRMKKSGSFVTNKLHLTASKADLVVGMTPPEAMRPSSLVTDPNTFAGGRSRSKSNPLLPMLLTTETAASPALKQHHQAAHVEGHVSVLDGMEGLSIDGEVSASRIPSGYSRQSSRQSFGDLFPDSDNLETVNLTEHKAKSYRNYNSMGRQIGKGNLNMEYSDHGTGDFRTPSFRVHNLSDGSDISPLRYKSHKILAGKVPHSDSNMPHVRASQDRFGWDDATTLVITMSDSVSGLEVDLIYHCMHDYDAIIRRVAFKNVSRGHGSGTDLKILDRAFSTTLDFEATTENYHMVQLSGSWARERMTVETKLSHGMQSFGSIRGVSSHQHNPFAAITVGPPNESNGEVKGFSFVYSGNFLVEAELNEMGRLRFNMGIHPMGFGWNLAPGDTFETPEVVMVRSKSGMGGMSRTLHRLTLDKICPASWSDHVPTQPPILLNSWEARYFNVNHDNIVDMAYQAQTIGADLLVLDDGWFGLRNDDESSLGDWYPNLTKFPHGISGLAQAVNGAGVKFGIWVEPEMVSEESTLYKRHPEWCLHVPGRPRQIGRNQLVLDLSRSEVVDYLYEQLSKLFRSANIEYVKWDMNRPLTEAFSTGKWTGAQEKQGLGGVRQNETSHRFVLGVYELMGRLTREFPGILLENCASGGGRFDLGLLYFSPQIWCSDNTDALTRMRIQYGTSFAYPARCIGAHVSCVPNHITANYTRARTRAFVAMCGTYGYELDVSKCTPAEIELFQTQSAVYRHIAHTVRNGDLYRLWDPFKVCLLLPV